MTPLVVAWVVWLLAIATRVRSSQRRRDAAGRQLLANTLDSPLAPADGESSRRSSPLAVAGSVMSGVVCRVTGGRIAIHPSAHRALPLGVLLTLLGASTSVLFGAVMFGAAVVGVWVAPIRRQRVHQATLLDDLPETAELIALAALSGAGLQQAVAIAARAARGPLSAELEALLARVGRGARFRDACAELGKRQPVLLPLTSALTATEHHGVSLVDSLERLTDEVRVLRRRRAEARARRAPVALLFPLVCCTLPAFGLLSIVPMFVSGIGSLHIPS